MATSKSEKKKSGPQAADQNRDRSNTQAAGDSDESEELEQASVSGDASGEETTGDDGESQSSERQTNTKSTKPQPALLQTTDSEQASQESEIGGLIVVAVIFVIIGLAIAIQILTQ